MTKYIHKSAHCMDVPNEKGAPYNIVMFSIPVVEVEKLDMLSENSDLLYEEALKTEIIIKEVKFHKPIHERCVILSFVEGKETIVFAVPFHYADKQDIVYKAYTLILKQIKENPQRAKNVYETAKEKGSIYAEYRVPYIG